MAKKSARSKGYRSYKKEVKGFTEAEKKTMIIGFAVLLVIIICVIAIPNAIRAKGSLKVKDGVVQDVGDNWLITDTSSTSKPLYKKVAEVSPAEGYELKSVEEGLSDKQERYYYYAPVDAENAVAQEYYAIVGKGEYDALCGSAATAMTGYVNEVLNSTEPVFEEVDGHKIGYYVLEYNINTSEDPENPVYQYTQNVSLYVDCNIDGRCVLLSATNVGDDETVFQDHEAIVEMLKGAAKQVVLA